MKVRNSTIVGVASLFVFGGAVATMPESTDVKTVASGETATTTTSTAATTTPAPTTTGTVIVPATANGDLRRAYVALASLAVKGRAPKTGYDRANFGPAWSDDVTVEAGHNGCDTRNDILRRDLANVGIKPDSMGCAVMTGTLTDPYSGTTIDFVRGTATSEAVQIDHVVALSDAWQKGAQQLDQTTRENFANDPRNLLAVDGPTNGGKSDGDAATWLPPNKDFRCTMVAMQALVKADYALWVTAAERDAMKRVLDGCTEVQLPGPVPPPDRSVVTTTVRATARAEAPRTTTPEPTYAPAPVYRAPEPTYTPEPTYETTYVPAPVYQAPESDGGVYYSTCGDAKAVGAGPFYRGQPGYRPGLDRDGDGVACEAN